MQAAGTQRRITLDARRTIANNAPPLPSAYVVASNGRTAIKKIGISTAIAPIAISRPAYNFRAWRGGSVPAYLLAAPAPAASPPMNAASTVLAAARPWPMCNVSRRVQTTS